MTTINCDCPLNIEHSISGQINGRKFYLHSQADIWKEYYASIDIHTYMCQWTDNWKEVSGA
jgi:hypothetical protein